MPERTAEIIPPGTEEKMPRYPLTAVMVEEYRKEKPEVVHSTRKIDLAKNQEILRQIFEKHGVKVTEGERIDVYNPSNEFELNGETYMAGRAEPRSSEFDSLTIFFKKEGEHWEPLPGPIFKLQDPSITKIGDEFVLCGVELELGTNALMKLFGIDKKVLHSYKTVFLKGKTLEDLKEFTEGPDDMKDVRLVELDDHRIGVYTRPRRLPDARRGQIGFTIINSLAELDWRVIKEAPLLNIRFPESEWGGTNENSLLPDGRVFVLGHRAYYDRHSQRHYYPWAFIHDPKTGAIEDLGILAERSDFPKGPAKRPGLADILFSAGIKLLKNGRILLKVGMSDCEVGEMERDIPTRTDPTTVR